MKNKYVYISGEFRQFSYRCENPFLGLGLGGKGAGQDAEPESFSKSDENSEIMS